MKISLVCLVILFIFVQADGRQWSYQLDGEMLVPDDWRRGYPDCDGSKQSPISIYNPPYLEIPPLVFGYQSMNNAVVINNGYTLFVKQSDFSNATLTGGGLSDTYKLVGFNFHWGRSGQKGSEHMISLDRYDAEIHFVHYNTKYADFTEAVYGTNGLVVIAIFIEFGESNSQFQGLVDDIRQVTTKGSRVNHNGTIDLMGFLGHGPYKFYRYEGSLPVPPCTENVVWFVWKDPISFSQQQIAELRNLKYSDNRRLMENFRPKQPTFFREIRRNFE